MRRLLGTLAVALAALLWGGMGCRAACHEDEPCWDCSTMGNRVCGPVEPIAGSGW